MQKNAKLGIGCLVAPPIVFILTLVFWAIISRVGGSMVQSDQAATGLSLLNVSFGLFGILCLLALPLGIIIGMVLLLKKDKEPKETDIPHVN
ncbi:MAG: hypothetical protein WC750_04310 [Patescibacteria group bacterium]|jgi:hypothetical protein